MKDLEFVVQSVHETLGYFESGRDSLLETIKLLGSSPARCIEIEQKKASNILTDFW